MRTSKSMKKQVLTAKSHIHPITDAQKSWGFQHSVHHYAYRLKSGKTTCMDCGHTFTTDKNVRERTCPHCKKALTIRDTQMRKETQRGYFSIITTCRGLQVIRIIFVRSYHKKGQAAKVEYTEVMQKWLNSDGDTVSLATGRYPSYWVDLWSHESNLRIRNDEQAYDAIDLSVLYPHYRVISAIKRNGFKGDFYNSRPFEFFHLLLTNSRMETLIKNGYGNMIQFFRKTDIEKYWASFKICMRNHYQIEDVDKWCKMINILTQLGKDTHNAKFVCPTDLAATFDKWLLKKAVTLEPEGTQRDIMIAQGWEKKFREMKSKFFGIQFTDGTINVRVLESVEEYRQEGLFMQHCVFKNRYYDRKDSIILSASINGIRVETIELSLKDFSIMQCLGFEDKTTKYHNQILNLVNKNSHLFAERTAA